MAYFRAFVLPLANCELQLTVISLFSFSPVDAPPFQGGARFAGLGRGEAPLPPRFRVCSWSGGVAPGGLSCFSAFPSPVDTPPFLGARFAGPGPGRGPFPSRFRVCSWSGGNLGGAETDSGFLHSENRLR